MVQSPSWEANWFAASQEIPRISRNPKVHYRTHKHPPPVSILGQLNPVHTPTSHLLEIHPNIIHPSTPRSPQWSPSLLFPHQEPIHPPVLTHTRHMPSPSHYPANIFPSTITHTRFLLLSSLVVITSGTWHNLLLYFYYCVLTDENQSNEIRINSGSLWQTRRSKRRLCGICTSNMGLTLSPP